MAHIKLKDLVLNSTVDVDLFGNLDSFIQDLSKCELALQGGKRRSVTPVIPDPIVSNWPTPVDPLSEGFFPIVANFYV